MIANLIALLIFLIAVLIGGNAVLTGLARASRSHPWWWTSVLGVSLSIAIAAGLELFAPYVDDGYGVRLFSKLCVAAVVLPSVILTCYLLRWRPRNWPKRILPFGIGLFLAVQTIIVLLTTCWITLVIQDASGRPLSGWEVRTEVDSPFTNNKQLFKRVSSVDGKAIIPVKIWESARCGVFRPYELRFREDGEEWLGVSLELDRLEITTLRASWRMSNFSEFRERIHCEFRGRPRAFVVPVITKLAHEGHSLGYKKAWSAAFPEAQITAFSLDDLSSRITAIAALGNAPERTRENVEMLSSTARLLRGFASEIRRIDEVRSIPTVAKLDQRTAFLCNYVVGRCPPSPEERLVALGTALESWSELLMSAVEPWMRSGREAYSILEEMGPLAQPACRKFADLYSELDSDTQWQLLQTFFSLKPDPAEVLFVLDAASPEGVNAFRTALRVRSGEFLSRDKETLESWLRANPGKLDPGQVEELRSELARRQ